MDSTICILLTFLIPTWPGESQPTLSRVVLKLPDVNAVPDDYLEHYMEPEAQAYWLAQLPEYLTSSGQQLIEVDVNVISHVVVVDA